MSQVISGSTSTSITLTTPATVTSTGTITSNSPTAAVVDGNIPGSLLNGGLISGMIEAVNLTLGGDITNQSGGYITGVAGIISSAGSIDNAGHINGVEIGLELGNVLLTNEVGGQISGGVQFTSGTLINSGTIAKATGGIADFTDGGAVFNLGTTADLTGGDVAGVAISGAPGYVFNQGSISGVLLRDVGTVTNQGAISTGSLNSGIEISGLGDVANTGNILGVALYGGGLVSNASGGTISGNLNGIYLTAGGTVSNSGKILGTGGLAGQILPGSAGNAGISMSAGGTIVNATKASLIDGTNYGIQVSGTGPGAVTITNFGTIEGGHEGILDNGSLNTTIFDYGTIVGSEGVAVAFGSGNDLLVLGTSAVLEGLVIGGSGNDTIELDFSTLSSLSNDFVNINEFINSAPTLNLVGPNTLAVNEVLDNGNMLRITGTLQTQGTVENTGTVAGQILLGGYYADSISDPSPAAAITNAVGGLITSSLATAIDAMAGTHPATIENAGTIADTGSSGVAISFSNSLADELVLDPGSKIIGKVVGGGGTGSAGSVLYLASGATTGTITSVGSSYVNFAEVSVAPGAVWDISSSTITALDNSGTIILDPTTMTLSGLTGAGLTEIGDDSELILTGSAATGAVVGFSGTNAVLDLTDVQQFNGTISSFGSGATIDLSNVAYDTPANGLLLSNDVLVIPEGGVLEYLQLDPSQNYTGEFFHISSDGLNGTDITESSMPCFLAGTRIATPSGDIAVELLEIGDLVRTARGPAKPVKWIGRRYYKAPLPENPDIIPVLIKAGAFAPKVPDDDLYLSPQHAVFLDGFLVPAGALINEVSVLACPEIDSVDYFHLELDGHETILANGAEAETFADHAGRQMFDNAEEYYRLYPEGWAAECVLFAPRLEFGPDLDRLRRKVALRAGLLLEQPKNTTVVGFLESADRQTISGWAYAPSQPNMPVSLEILNRGALLARTVANIPRPDVKVAGFGHGRCGFSITLPAPLPSLMRHEISVRPAGGATCLTGSPAVIDPGIAHDLLNSGGLQTLLDAAVKGLGSAKDVAHLGSSLEAAGKQIQLRAAKPRDVAKPAAIGGRPFVLVLDEAWPTITFDAGSNAVMSHIAAFQELGYDVAFHATSGPPPHDAAYAGLARLEALGVTCHGHDGMTTEGTIRALADQGLAVVYLHRLATASAYSGLVRQIAGAKVIFSVADLHHLRLMRQAEVTNRPDLAQRAKSVRAAEFWAMQLADCVVTHSSFEAAYLRREAPKVNVRVVPWVVAPARFIRSGKRREHVAFIGGAGHAPNVDAVSFLARDVMPRVWEQDPSIKCFVAGPGWAEHFFNKFDLRIVNVGHQPDLLPLLQSVRLTVAPLRFGAGVKGKVLESMAAGTACVMSEIAAEGLPLDAQLRAVVGDEDRLVENILAAYADRKLNRLLVQAGLDMIETGFSKPATTTAMAAALGLRDIPAARPAPAVMTGTVALA